MKKSVSFSSIIFIIADINYLRHKKKTQKNQQQQQQKQRRKRIRGMKATGNR